MRVVAETPLLSGAVEALGPVRDSVVVVGALAVEIALADSETALTPTRDVDAGAEADDVEAIITHLEEAEFSRSEESHERSFTWVKGDLKVQLMRSFHPFPSPRAEPLPQNNLVAQLPDNRWEVAFAEEPERGLLWAARPAMLVAMKEFAFGRERHGEPGTVERDFSDAALLLDHHRDLIVREVTASAELRQRVERAASRLAEEPTFAARQLVALGQVENVRSGEALVRRIAGETLADLEPA